MAKIKRSDVTEEDVFKGITDSAKNSIASLEAMNTQFKEIAKSIKLVVSTQKLDSTGSLKEFSQATAEATKNLKQQLQVKAEIEKVSKLQAKAEQELERIQTQKAKTQNEILKGTIAQTREQERLVKAVEREEKAQTRLESRYARVNQWLSKLRSEYRDLAIKKELNNSLSEKEETRMNNLQKRIETYDSALKKVDATMGLHQRNVGNYASGFNSLGNSINQLTREAPAFANSMQTGFMAISNNLPIFYDAIKGIKDANKELQAQGQPTTSVLKQIGSSLFSFQTALSLGVTLLTIYGAKIVDWVANAINPANKAIEKQNELRKRQNERIQEQLKFISEESSNYVGLLFALQQTNKGSQERLDLIKEINDKYKTTLQNIQDETLFQDQLNKSVDQYLIYKEAEFKIKKNEDLLALNLAKQGKLIYEINKQTIDSFKLRKQYDPSLTQKDLYKELELNKELIKQAREKDAIQFSSRGSREEIFKQLEELADRARSYGLNIGNNQIKLNQFNSTLQQNADKTKNSSKEQKQLNEYVEHYAELIEKIVSIEQKREIENKNKQINKEAKNQLESAKYTGKFNTYDFQKLFDEERKIKMQQNQINYNYEMSQADKKYKELEEKYKGHEDSLIKIQLDKKAEQELINKKYTELNLSDIEENNKKEIDLYEQLAQAQADFEASKFQASSDAQKKYWDDLNQQVKSVADFFIQQSNRKISQLDYELNMYQKQASYLQALASNGNIQAQQSIAKTDQLQADAEKKKIQQMKNQEKIKLAEAVFQTYSNYSSDKNVKNPVVKTITDVTLLEQFINTLPTFYEGTETTVSDALGTPQLQGKDGYMVRVDGSEKVLNPELSAMTGNMTTFEIAKLAEDKLRGNLMQKTDITHSTNWATSLVINELKELKDIIKNKPENKVEVGELLNGVMHVVETTKQGNTSTRNITRLGR